MNQDEEIAALLHAHIPEFIGAWLFGSAARGDARADSDLDVAVYAGPPLKRDRLHRARLAIESKLGRDVDLIDLQGASSILAFMAMTEGRRIAAPHPLSADLLEIRILREYEDLKRRRAEIEADIARRGKVYG